MFKFSSSKSIDTVNEKSKNIESKNVKPKIKNTLSHGYFPNDVSVVVDTETFRGYISYNDDHLFVKVKDKIFGVIYEKSIYIDDIYVELSNKEKEYCSENNIIRTRGSASIGKIYSCIHYLLNIGTKDYMFFSINIYENDIKFIFFKTVNTNVTPYLICQKFSFSVPKKQNDNSDSNSDSNSDNKKKNEETSEIQQAEEIVENSDVICAESAVIQQGEICTTLTNILEEYVHAEECDTIES